MTTSRFSRIRNRVSRITIDGVREKHLAPIAREVRSFEDLGGPPASGGWIVADDQPALFERDPEALQRDLTELWRKHGREQLIPLAEPVAKLADQARQEPLRADRAVSSSVYALQ